MTGRAPTSFEKVLATVFYAPLGLGAKLVDDLPTNITKAKQQIDFARFIGKMAVERGVNELTDKLRDATRSSVEVSDVVIEARSVEVADDLMADPLAVDADQLALADYDQLAASHIISKLAGLTDAEITEIEQYELAHRGRRTVLGKIDQIRLERS